MSKSSYSDSENIVTFVQEGTTHAVNFEREPHRKLAAINVSQCHILEITNRDADNKRKVMSLSHFMVPHLTNQRSLNKSVARAIENFLEHGGELTTAQFKIYGGVEGENTLLRNKLKEAIVEYLRAARVEITEQKIIEPKGHEVKRSEDRSIESLFEGRKGESIDYLFDRDGTSFRKSVPNGEDVVSANLRDEANLAAYQDFLDEQWARVETSIGFQTRDVESDLGRGNNILRGDSLRRALEEAEKIKDRSKMLPIIKIIETQSEIMSLKVCDRNGLMDKFKSLVRPTASIQVTGEKGPAQIDR